MCGEPNDDEVLIVVIHTRQRILWMTMPGCSVFASKSWVKSSVFDEVHGNTMSLKEHVEEFMMFHPFLFRSTKTIKHLQLYNKNNHNYNPTTHNHLGPPIWSLPGPRWSSLDTDESHSIFQARPRLRYPTFSSFWDGFVGAFCNIWWGFSENPTFGNLKLDLWIHLFGCPTHHPPPTTCEESHPTSAGGVLLFIEPDVLQSPLNSASAKRPCRNTKSEQERIWFFFTGLECEVSGFEDLSKGSGFSSVSICALY